MQGCGSFAMTVLERRFRAPVLMKTTSRLSERFGGLGFDNMTFIKFPLAKTK
jgi:hypothetical protein